MNISFISLHVYDSPYKYRIFFISVAVALKILTTIRPEFLITCFTWCFNTCSSADMADQVITAMNAWRKQTSCIIMDELANDSIRFDIFTADNSGIFFYNFFFSCFPLHEKILDPVLSILISQSIDNAKCRYRENHTLVNENGLKLHLQLL